MSNLHDPQLMPDSEFNAALESAANSARGLLLTTRPRSFTPMMHLCQFSLDGATGELTPFMTIVLLSGFNMDLRRQTLDKLGAQMGRDMAIIRAAFFLSEAWVSMQPANEPRKYRLPEDDPNRQEVITVAGLTLDGRAAMAKIDVRRDKSERMIPGEITLLLVSSEVKVKNAIVGAFFMGYQRGLREALAEVTP